MIRIEYFVQKLPSVFEFYSHDPLQYIYTYGQYVIVVVMGENCYLLGTTCKEYVSPQAVSRADLLLAKEWGISKNLLPQPHMQIPFLFKAARTAEDYLTKMQTDSGTEYSPEAWIIINDDHADEQISRLINLLWKESPLLSKEAA